MVPHFKYLGIVLSTADNDWMVVIQNLTKAQTVWRRMSSILIRNGARPRVSGFFFKSVVQSVLIFDAEMWVVSPTWDGDGRFPIPGSAVNDVVAATEKVGRKVGVNLSGGKERGGGV